MILDQENAVVFAPTSVPCQPELLVAAVLQLMSNYTARPNEAGGCLKLASVIERHLQAIANLPATSSVLRATCNQLSEQWAEMVDRRMSGRLPAAPVSVRKVH